MPPTLIGSASSTSTDTPAFDSRYAAVSPAGPAPMTATRLETSGWLLGMILRSGLGGLHEGKVFEGAIDAERLESWCSRTIAAWKLGGRAYGAENARSLR